MTIRIQADTDTAGVCHRWYPESKLGTLSFGSTGHGNHLYFNDTADIDEVIAELTALRAEMTAEPECGFQWKSADGLMHACALGQHGELFGHVTWTADGTVLRPETAASVTA